LGPERVRWLALGASVGLIGGIELIIKKDLYVNPLASNDNNKPLAPEKTSKVRIIIPVLGAETKEKWAGGRGEQKAARQIAGIDAIRYASDATRLADPINSIEGFEVRKRSE